MGKGLYIAIGIVAVAGVAGTVYLMNQRKKFEAKLIDPEVTGTVIVGGNAVAETSTVLSQGNPAQAMMIPAYRPGSRPDITGRPSLTELSGEISRDESTSQSLAERPMT